MNSAMLYNKCMIQVSMSSKSNYNIDCCISISRCR